MALRVVRELSLAPQLYMLSTLPAFHNSCIHTLSALRTLDCSAHKQDAQYSMSMV
jgi:hypothetical protein